jgi:hypothetical protein
MKPPDGLHASKAGGRVGCLLHREQIPTDLLSKLVESAWGYVDGRSSLG